MARFGNVTRDVTGKLKFRDQCQFDQGVIGIVGKGDIYYVDKGKATATTGDGSSWDAAFLTITEAVAAAGDYDTIIIAPGYYTEAATLTITQIGLRIFGLNPSGKTRGPCGIKTPTVAGPMITLTSNTASTGANDFEIAGLSFLATSGQKAIQLGTAAEGYVWRPYIHDCGFFGDSTGTYAVAVYGATTSPAAGAFPDCAECVVERCHFYAWVTACTCVYGTRHMLRGNTMFVPDSGIGIVLGAGRPFDEISSNIIHGTGTSTGIAVTGNDDSAIIVTNNTINGCSTLITDKVSDGGVAGNNWTYGGLATASVADPTA